MKLTIIFLVLLSLFVCSVQAAKREQVLIILGDPGLLTTMSYMKFGNGAVGTRGYMGKKSGNTNFKVSELEFKELWEMVNSESFKAFEFKPTDEDNMADPDFYNLTVINGRKEKFMRVPRNGDFVEVEKLKLYIEK